MFICRDIKWLSNVVSGCELAFDNVIDPEHAKKMWLSSQMLHFHAGCAGCALCVLNFQFNFKGNKYKNF